MCFCAISFVFVLFFCFPFLLHLVTMGQYLGVGSFDGHG